MVVPEMERRKFSEGQLRPGSRPYPSFSKAHSREAVNSIQDPPRTKPEPITPEGTDLSPAQPPKSAPPRSSRHASQSGQAPPSPPLSVDRREARLGKNGAEARPAVGDTRRPHGRRKSAGHEDIYGKPGFSASRTSLRQAEEGISVPKHSSAKPAPISRASFLGFFKDKGEKSGLASGKKSPLHVGTSKPQPRKASDREPHTSLSDPKSGRRPPTLLSNNGSSHSDDDLPRTPRGHEGPPRTPFDRKATPVLEVFTSHGSDSDFDVNTGPPHSTTTSPPPPPPPPAVAPQDIPKVDFLLQDGGLSATVPRSFASAMSQETPTAYHQYLSPQPTAAKENHIQSTFDPYHKLLEDFTNVISKNGSIAVATGYRSVAKGLLDRLESVFSRNLSSEFCQCALCDSQKESQQESEEANRVSWGEVLELISGRRQSPPWPPFILATSTSGLGISAVENQTPMQKLDMDVPEEYREHYIRQSKKTKQAVDTWLASQPEEHQSPPQEVDDETLTFAMLTNLEPSQRRAFTALLRELSAVPSSRSSTPMQANSNKPKFLSKTGIALQRLYRLPRAPRDPECSMYLLKNQSLHSALATMAAISSEEWETLVSGRFDEFLRTGDTTRSDSVSPVRRNPTPSSRTATPLATNGQNGSAAPTVATSSAQTDEDTEIAVLAEVEREIYLGMESLEDAFELLHAKAEGVRRALRERSAGLALQAQARRGGAEGEKPEARLGTPAVGNGLATAGQSAWLPDQGKSNSKLDHGPDDEDGPMFDERSELAPDDSASNIGWKERERKKHKKRRAVASRRTERRTPAPVEEEDEG